jgi:hypothetical protein
METMNFSFNKTTIIALIVGLFVGGLIGCMIGSHHNSYRGSDRGHFSRGFKNDGNTRAMPMMQDMQKMMDEKNTPSAPQAIVPENTPVKN